MAAAAAAAANEVDLTPNVCMCNSKLYMLCASLRRLFQSIHTHTHTHSDRTIWHNTWIIKNAEHRIHLFNINNNNQWRASRAWCHLARNDSRPSVYLLCYMLVCASTLPHSYNWNICLPHCVRLCFNVCCDACSFHTRIIVYGNQRRLFQRHLVEQQMGTWTIQIIECVSLCSINQHTQLLRMPWYFMQLNK